MQSYLPLTKKKLSEEKYCFVFVLVFFEPIRIKEMEKIYRMEIETVPRINAFDVNIQ